MKVSGVRGERTGFRCQVLGVRGRHRSKAKGPGIAEPLFLLGDLDGGWGFSLAPRTSPLVPAFNIPATPAGPGLAKGARDPGRVLGHRLKMKKPRTVAGHFSFLIPATTYSPTRFPAQYHGPWRA
jgi:hypothetical protein